jgi:hypothetical protein
MWRVAGPVVAAALAAAQPASADYRNRHGEWWVECYSRDEGPFGYACAGRTTSRDGLQLYVVERRGQPFVVVQAEAGIQFDRSQHVMVRIDEGERFQFLAQQRRVAHVGGDEGLRLVGLMIDGGLAYVTYNDLFGQNRIARFPMDGFEPTYRELKQAMAEVDQAVPRQARPDLPDNKPPGTAAANDANPPATAGREGKATQPDRKEGALDDVVDDVGDFFGRVGRFIGRQFE